MFMDLIAKVDFSLTYNSLYVCAWWTLSFYCPPTIRISHNNNNNSDDGTVQKQIKTANITTNQLKSNNMKNRRDNEYIRPLSNSHCFVYKFVFAELNAYALLHWMCMCQKVKLYWAKMTIFIRFYDRNWKMIAVIRIQSNDNLMALAYFALFHRLTALV